MARLPDTYAPRRIADFSRPMAGTNSANTIESAFDRLGRAIEGVGDASEFIVDRDAAVRAVDRDTTFARNVNALLYDPENGFLTTSKENAVEGRKATLERLKTMGDDVFKDLDPRVASKVRPAIERRIESAMATIDRHTATERRNWMVGSLDARTNRAMDDALTAYNSDDVIEENLKIGIDALEGTRKLMGWSDEEFAANREAFVSKTFRETAMRRAKDNPVAALEFARKNRDRMSGKDLADVEAVLEPLAKDYRGREYARNLAAGGALPPTLSKVLTKRESGGDYSALFKFSNREGGRFAGVDVTKMTIAEVIEFTKPDGDYANWVKGEIGRVATPVGAGQIVGTTLRQAVKELGLPEDTVFSPAVQDRIIWHLAQKRIKPGMSQTEKRAALRAEWAGFSKVSNADMDTVIAEIEGGPVTVSGDDALQKILAIPDPRERDAALGEWKMLEALKEGQVKKARAELERAIFEGILSGEFKIEDLDPRVAASLGTSEWKAIFGVQEKLAKKTPVVTDPAAYYELRNIAELDPKGFAEVNLIEYADKLSASDLKQMIDDQAKVRAGEKIDPTYSGWREALTMNGLGDLVKDDTKMAALLPKWRDTIDGFIAVNGRKPRSDEEVDLMARLLAPTATGASWYSPRNNEEPAYVFAENAMKEWNAGNAVNIDGEMVSAADFFAVLRGAEARNEGAIDIVDGIRIWREVRAFLPDPEYNGANAPGMPAAPAADAIPGAGGRDAAVPGIGGARSGMGLPGVSQGLGEVSTREADIYARVPDLAGLPDVPQSDDAWETFGAQAARVLGMSGRPVRLSNGMTITTTDWTEAVEELPADASYGEIAKRAFEIARSGE